MIGKVGWLQEVIKVAGDKAPLQPHRPIDELATVVKSNQRGVIAALENLTRQLEALALSQGELKSRLETEALGIKIEIIPTTLEGLVALSVRKS
jgi:hypothetical protein